MNTCIGVDIYTSLDGTQLSLNLDAGHGGVELPSHGLMSCRQPF